MDSIWLPYLKDLLIQDSGAKDSNALCVDDGLVASAERPGHLLLTVHNDGDALLVDADGYAMPSVQHEGNIRYEVRNITRMILHFLSFQKLKNKKNWNWLSLKLKEQFNSFAIWLFANCYAS